MKYLDFKIKLAKHVCFSLSDIRVFDPTYRRRQLYEWQDQGYIRKIRRGFYMFTETSLSEAVLFALSNKIYPHSYVSLESALSVYGLIPEGVFTVTAVSTKNTSSFETGVGTFDYHHIKPALFKGYTLRTDTTGVTYKIATPEKTLLDYIYFHPEIATPADFEAWRFNSAEFLKIADLEVVLASAQADYRKGFIQKVARVVSMIKNDTYA